MTPAPVREERAPLSDVELSLGERGGLLREHGRCDSEWRDVWDDATRSIVEKDIPFDAPICGRCREPWGREGCRTVRAILLLGIRERELSEKARRVSELQEALSPRFGVERLREPGNQTAALRMQVDHYTLMHGRMGVVDAVLRKMRDHWRDWFKKVGDLERIAADHSYALELDSDYYVYLTQDFRAPSAFDFHKPPNAPWVNAPFVSAPPDEERGT